MTDNKAVMELSPHKDKGKYTIVSVKKYEELCLKAEAIKDIRAEIEEYSDLTDIDSYKGKVLDIIDRHIGKDKE